MTTLKESKEIDDDPEDTGITIKVSESAVFSQFWFTLIQPDK